MAALVPLLFSTLGLAAWVTGILQLASARPEYIPMAPSTAIAFLLLSGGLIAVASNGRESIRKTVRAVAVLLVLLASIKLIEFLTSLTIFNFEAELIAVRPPSLSSCGTTAWAST